MFLGLTDPHPDPLVRGTDPRIRIRIRIRTKMSLIPNNGIFIIKRSNHDSQDVSFSKTNTALLRSLRMKHEAVAPYLGLEELGNPGNVWDEVLLLPG